MSISSLSSNSDIYSLFTQNTSTYSNNQSNTQTEINAFTQAKQEEINSVHKEQIESSSENLSQESFAKSVIENIKEGESFTDAIRNKKQEEFQSYFNEELEKNGGDVNAAIKVAEARVKGGLSDEEMYESIMALAGRYKDIDKEVSDQLIEYAEELAKQMLLDPKKALSKLGNESEKELLSLLSSSKGVDSEKIVEEMNNLEDNFIEKLGIVKNFEEKQKNTDSVAQNNTKLRENPQLEQGEASNQHYNEQEKREMNFGIKQYEKVSLYR